jgi:uncharacterized protein YecE (DUF72 family)
MRLNDAKKIETNKFLDRIHGFEENLGPAFIQMIEFYGNDNDEDLLAYLSWLPRDENIFVEVRHESWFTTEPVIRNFATKLNPIQKGWGITDTPRCGASAFADTKSVYPFCLQGR